MHYPSSPLSDATKLWVVQIAAKQPSQRKVQEKILLHVAMSFPDEKVTAIFDALVDAATGNTEGTPWEIAILNEIFAEDPTFHLDAPTHSEYFTNAPRSYDYGNYEVQYVDADHEGFRTLLMTPEQAEFQIPRNRSGLYWITPDLEEAQRLTEMAPWEGN